MDDFSFRNPANTIRNGIIEEISSANNNTFVTVSRPGNRRGEDTIRLVANRSTIVLDENGTPIPVRSLRVGMTVNASYSSATTRSIPPQAVAYIIQVIRRHRPDNNITEGRIINIDRRNRSITTISDSNLSSFIQFNLAPDVKIVDRFGRPVDFSRLVPGLRVQIRHAAFMTASIPPQTTAFKISIQ